MNIRVEIKGCDADTELELVCTDKQYAFLRELAKATKSVSFYDCMPIINLYENDSEVDEGITQDSETFKFVKGEDERGDDISYYELDTTKL